MSEKKLLKKKYKLIKKILEGGYDDKSINEVIVELDLPDRRVSQAAAAADFINKQVVDTVAANLIAKQDTSFKDRLETAHELKDKIREVADMNTMGAVKLGLGEAWFQGQGHDDDHLECPHCGGRLMINKLKKKLYKRKVRRNKAKGKSKPYPPKFLRTKEEAKKRPGPKRGGGKSEKQTEWMKYCKAVSKTPPMIGLPWNKVMKKASQLKKEGVSIDDIKKLLD